MEKFYLEEPSSIRREDAKDYINEFYKYNSDINGSGGLEKKVNNYNEWLQDLEEDAERIKTEIRVPARTYFLIRENDNRIIGMINIRLTLNEKLRRHGGNIGYSIRPTERGKGYNKINLYLGLLVCQQYGIDKVYLNANKENTASWKTMEAFGGVNTNTYYDVESNKNIKDYEIDVNKAIDKYSSLYEQFISVKEKNR